MNSCTLPYSSTDYLCYWQVEEEKDDQLASLSAELLRLHSSLLREKKRILAFIQVGIQRHFKQRKLLRNLIFLVSRTRRGSLRHRAER